MKTVSWTDTCSIEPSISHLPMSVLRGARTDRQRAPAVVSRGCVGVGTVGEDRSIEAASKRVSRSLVAVVL